MHEKCHTCFHKHLSKVYSPIRLMSPCYECLFNSEMIKTNNYVEAISVTSFNRQNTFLNDE